MKRTLLAMGAAVALAIAALPTAASAQHHRGGHFGHHFGGPRFSFGFGVGPGYYDYGYAGASCYRSERVLTPRGWRWRRVWMC